MSSNTESENNKVRHSKKKQQNHMNMNDDELDYFDHIGDQEFEE